MSYKNLEKTPEKYFIDVEAIKKAVLKMQENPKEIVLINQGIVLKKYLPIDMQSLNCDFIK